MSISEVTAFSKCTNSTMTSHVGKTETRKQKGREFMSLGGQNRYIHMNVGSNDLNYYNVSKWQFIKSY